MKQAGGKEQLGKQLNNSQTRRTKTPGTDPSRSTFFLLFNTLNQSISSFLSKGKGRNCLLPRSPQAGNCPVPHHHPKQLEEAHFNPLSLWCSSSRLSEQAATTSGHQPFLGSSEQTSQNSSQVCSLAVRKFRKSVPLKQRDPVGLSRRSRLQLGTGNTGNRENFKIRLSTRAEMPKDNYGCGQMVRAAKKITSSFQARKSYLNKHNWQSPRSSSKHTSFQEQGQPGKRFAMEAVGRQGW